MKLDLMKLKSENNTLSAKNLRLQKEIHALQNDPRVIERRAREIAPLVKENELLYQFKKDDKTHEIEVDVVVKKGQIMVGGKSANITSLPDLLREMKQETKEAVFKLTIKDDQINTAETKRLNEIIYQINMK